MIKENELLSVLIGVGILIFVFIHRRRLDWVPEPVLILLAFLVIFAGWVSTIVEGYILPAAFNFLEHICYMTSTILLAVWCYRVYIRKHGGPA